MVQNEDVQRTCGPLYFSVNLCKTIYLQVTFTDFDITFFEILLSYEITAIYFWNIKFL